MFIAFIVDLYIIYLSNLSIYSYSIPSMWIRLMGHQPWSSQLTNRHFWCHHSLRKTLAGESWYNIIIVSPYHQLLDLLVVDLDMSPYQSCPLYPHYISDVLSLLLVKTLFFVDQSPLIGKSDPPCSSCMPHPRKSRSSATFLLWASSVHHCHQTWLGNTNQIKNKQWQISL